MLSIRGKVRGVATGNSNCGDSLPSPSNLIQFLFDSEFDEIGVRLDDNMETIVFARYSDSSDHRQAHTHTREEQKLEGRITPAPSLDGPHLGT